MAFGDKKKYTTNFPFLFKRKPFYWIVLPRPPEVNLQAGLFDLGKFVVYP